MGSRRRGGRLCLAMTGRWCWQSSARARRG